MHKTLRVKEKSVTT